MLSSTRVFCGALGLIGLIANAYPAPEIDEIIVVAQKREQPAQEVGISMSTFDKDQIKSLRLFGSEELARQTPGLQATSFSGDPTVMLFAIRGVGQNDFTDHHEGPTAVYVDEAYVGALGAVGFQVFDLEQVEILRGPQGTLFGRNATGGLIQYISRKPSEEFSANIDVTAGDYNLLRVEGAIGGSLASRVQARLSILTHTADGYLNNRIGPDIHEVDQQAARLQLRFDIDDAWDALLKVHVAKDNETSVGAFQHRASIPGADGLGEYLPDDVNADYFGLGSCPGCDALGYKDSDGDPWSGDYDMPGKFDRDSSGATLNVSWQRDNLTFASVTDYLNLDKSYGEDSDGSPNPLLFFESVQDAQQFSQEFRLMKIAEPLTWTVGVYYLDIDGDYSSVLGSPLFDAIQTNDYSLATKSFALFGQIEYTFADDWRLIAGLRRTDEEKDFHFIPECGGTGCDGFFIFPGSGTVGDIGGFTPETVGDLASIDDSDFSAKLQLEWFSDDMLVYAGITRGQKAGGFNAPLDALLLPDEMQYDAEILTNYEAGLKTSWSDNKYILNASAFYYDYKDKQAFTFSGITTYLLNVPASAYGLELEWYVRTLNNFDATFGLALLEAEAEDVPLPSGRLADQTMAQAPKLTLNMILGKGWTVADGLLRVSVDGAYVSEQYFNSINHGTAKADPYQLWNARLEFFGENNRWSAAVFVNNVTDEDVVNYAIDVSSFGYSLLSYGPPRWVGAQFGYRWE